MGNLTSTPTNSFTKEQADQLYQARIPTGTFVSATELTQRLAGFAPASALAALPPAADIVRRNELSGFAPASALAGFATKSELSGFAPTSALQQYAPLTTTNSLGTAVTNLTGSSSPLNSRTLWCADGTQTCNVPQNRSLQIDNYNISTAPGPRGPRLCAQRTSPSPAGARFCFDGTNIVQG